MAYKGSQPFKISLEAGADLSAKQYYFMKLDSAGKAVVCAGVTDKPIGVLLNNPTAGQAAEIVVVGLTKVSSDAALAIGDQIGTSADGQAAPYVAGTDTTKYIVGAVLETSGAAGVINSVLVNCANPHRGA
jgi:hypothetical protein